MLPQNTTSNEVERVMKSILSVAYNVPQENLLVTITALPAVRRRMLLQEMIAMRFAVVVTVFFPIDATAADIVTTKTNLGSINSSALNAALKAAPTGLSIDVLESGPVLISQFSVPPITSPAPITSPMPITSPTPSPEPNVPSDNSDTILIVVGVGVGLLCVLAGILCCICSGMYMPGHQ